MNSKILLVFIGIFIVIGMIFTAYTAFQIQHIEESKMDPNEDWHTPNHQLEEHSQTQEEHSQIENEKSEEIPTAQNIVDFYQRPLQENEEDLSQAEADRYEQEARRYFREFKFSEGINFLHQVVANTPKDGNAEKLHELLFASSLLSNLPENEEEFAVEMQGIKNIMSNIRDVELLFLGVMKLDFLVRAEIIFMKDSLNPIYDGLPNILRIDREEGELLENIRLMHPDAEILHRILFEIEENQLYSYILEYVNGDLIFYSIQNIPGQKSPYKTISEWESIFRKIQS